MIEITSPSLCTRNVLFKLIKKLYPQPHDLDLIDWGSSKDKVDKNHNLFDGSENGAYGEQDVGSATGWFSWFFGGSKSSQSTTSSLDSSTDYSSSYTYSYSSSSYFG